MDLESNGFHRYPERVCLVQLKTADDTYLIDPLTIEDISPLGELLAAPSVLKIFHAADYDIRSLDRDWSFPVLPLFDTSIAAAFIGYRSLGLATLLKERLDVEIPKSKRLQRADWTIRPIAPELREYAAADVRHLGRLAMLFRQRLDELGRTEWAKEECERLSKVRYNAPNPENAYLSMKGISKLDGRGLAVVRSLHEFRHHEALRRDRPPFKIFSDSVILALAQNPDIDLSSVKGIGRYAYGRNLSAFRNALRRGLTAPPVERPRPVESPRPRIGASERNAVRKRLSLLKKWRSEHASRLEIEVGIVWPAVSLERLAADPERLEDELMSGDVRQWQQNELAASLSSFVRKI